MALVCSRCGRRAAPDEDATLGTPLELLGDEPSADGRVLLEGRAWSRIGDRDVCPDCLTVDEERALAGSYIGLVEAEVARLAAREAEPEPHEAQLIAYAMVLRKRLAGTSCEPPPPPADKA
jgi:hypothetical protein